MSRGINGGIVILLMIVAAVAGGLAGYFIPRGGADTSTEGRISYACELSAEIADAEFSLDDWGDPDRAEIFQDITVIASLFGGFGLPPTDTPTVEEQFGTDLYMAMTRLDGGRMNATLADIADYCEAR